MKPGLNRINKRSRDFSILVICLSFWANGLFAQAKEQSLKNLFNEFHVSANHGIVSPRTFFGAGFGAGHIFKADRVIGARIGLEVDLFHFWNGGISTPEYKYESRSNQHFYATTITVPVELQLNFGKRVRYLFEMGFHLGVNPYTQYIADIKHYGSYPYTTEHVNSKMSFGLLGGLNMGTGVRIPLNDRLSFLIKPGIGMNIYFSETPMYVGFPGNAYAKLSLGIHLK